MLSVGADDLNLRLSENRANSVRNFLIGQAGSRNRAGSWSFRARLSEPRSTGRSKLMHSSSPHLGHSPWGSMGTMFSYTQVHR